MSKQKRVQWILWLSLLILIVVQWDGLLLMAQETVTSVDGGMPSFDSILTRYGAFAPFLLGLIIIALRRKFFPDPKDKE
jgi:hypothetical protein